MANAKSFPDAEAGEERIEHIGRVSRADGPAQLFGRRTNAVGEKDKVGGWGSGGVRKWRSGGEESSGLD